MVSTEDIFKSLAKNSAVCEAQRFSTVKNVGLRYFGIKQDIGNGFVLLPAGRRQQALRMVCLIDSQAMLRKINFVSHR